MQNQYLNSSRYLLIDLEGALEEVKNPKDSDLVIQRNTWTETYIVLKNGAETVKLLHSLVDEYGFTIVSHSQMTEQDQITWFETFERICKENNIKPLPSVAAMAVNDSSCFQNITPEKPSIIQDHSHGIHIAGYDQSGKWKIPTRIALSELLSIKESERKFHVILDHDQQVVGQAREEGWLTNTIGVPAIAEVIKRLKKNVENQSKEERKEIQEKRDADSNSTLPALSEKKFKKLDKSVEHGSSASSNWYFDESSNTTWYGKCSFKGAGGWVIEQFVQYVREPDSFDEYREYLASKLYSLFGVRTPELLLSIQPLNSLCRGMSLAGLNDLHGPRIHLMSQFIDGFKELGKNFIENYYYSSVGKYSAQYHKVEGEKDLVPLKGFGRALAVSILVHDYDCFGNSGGNMGYIVHSDGFAELVKIDPGEALSFADDMSLAKVDNDPGKRAARIGTSGGIIKYTDLNYEDKKEFAEGVRSILETPNSLIEDLFRPFLEMDKRFETILSTLLKRKKGILYAFSEEVRVLILNQMKDAKEEKAKNLIANWEKTDRSFTPSSKEAESTIELIKSRAYLEATILSSQTSNSSKMFQVPSSTEKFIGRKEELNVLQRHLSLSKKKMNFAAIVGLSGLGKTQFAVEYIKSNQESYSDIVWLNAEQSSMIYHQIMMYLQVYRKFQPSKQYFEDKSLRQSKDLLDSHENCVQMFYQSFHSDKIDNKKRICIVLDNAQRIEDMIKYILSPNVTFSRNFDILITSSYQKWELPIEKIINLEKFSTCEVQEYLESKIYNIKYSKEHIPHFTELHDGLPLAIDQAIAHIQHKKLTLSQYIAHLEEFQKAHNMHFSLLDLVDEKSFQNAPLEENKASSEPDLNEDLLLIQQKKLSQHGFSSLVFSLDNLRNMNKSADSIIGVLAYLSADYITKSILQDCWFDYMKGMQGGLLNNSKLTHGQLFDEGLNLLIAHSFIKREEFKIENTGSKKSMVESNFASFKARESKDTIIKINCLTQSIVRLIHQQSGLFDVYYESVFDCILQKLEYDDRRLDEIQRVSWVISHGTALSNMKSKIGDFKYMEMLNKIGCYQLKESGEYKEALNKLKNALRIVLNVCGNDHPSTGMTLGNLGTAWGSLGNYEKQKDLLNRALEIFEKHYGKDHPSTGSILTNLGNAWGSLGNYEKQKDLLNRALEIYQKNYEKDHPQTGITLGHLGNAWGSLGNYEKQKDLLNRALEIFERHYGKDHPIPGITLGDLGNAWGNLGDYEKQKDLINRALEIKEKHYGKDHPETGITLCHLGNAWGSLGNYEKQKNLLNRALEIDEKHYGKDHPRTGSTLGNLGNAWGSLGDYEKKKDLLNRALEIFERHYGKDHPQTGSVLTNLGNAWGSFGNYEKKKDLLNRALEIFERHYGKDHPQTGSVLTNLGNAWGDLGDYEKQKDLSNRALEIFEKHYGKDHPETGITLVDLGNAWGSLGNYEKKKDLINRALEIKEKHYGKDHPSTGITLGHLGNAWGSLGSYENQKNLLNRALEIFERHYGKDHLQTGITLGNLGNAWGSLGNYEKQKDLLNRALEIYEKHYGKDHPQTGITLGNLGNAWGSLGSYEKQKNLLNRALEIFERHYGKDHPQTGAILTNLGNAWGSLGNYEKQKDLSNRALEIFERHYGKYHSSNGTILTNLGNAWGSLGNYENQKDLLLRALEIKEKHYGKDHPETGITLSHLGNVWGSLGNYEKKKDLLNRALEIFERHYGKDHPQTGSVLTNLGNAWGAFGDYEKQKDLLNRALEIFEKHYGKDHPETGITLANLGIVWGSLGNYEKKKDLLYRALEIFERHYGNGHPQTGSVLSHLGNAWGSLGNYEKQKDLLNRALEIKEKHYGKDHPETGITLYGLGSAFFSLKDPAMAATFFNKAHSIFAESYGEKHPHTKAAFNNLQLTRNSSPWK